MLCIIQWTDFANMNHIIAQKKKSARNQLRLVKIVSVWNHCACGTWW